MARNRQKDPTSVDRLWCTSFSSMLIAFMPSACSRDTWWVRQDGANSWGHFRSVNEWVSMCVFVCSMRRLVRPTGSPTANQTGWKETGPPLPLSRVVYRTEPQRWTSPQSATPSETSDGLPSGTVRRHTRNESLNTKCMVINISTLLTNGEIYRNFFQSYLCNITIA